MPTAPPGADREIQDGKEKVYELRYGTDPIRLPGREEKLWLVVIVGFGEQPIMLLTNLKLRARDSENLWWAAQIYWTIRDDISNCA